MNDDAVLRPAYLRQVNEELKAVVGRRLVLSPSAEFLRWLASTAYALRGKDHLTNDQWCVVEVVASWTFCRGDNWLPTDGVSTDQLRLGLDLPPHTGSKMLVTTAVDGVTMKGIWRMARGKSVKGNPNWYRFAFVDEILRNRPNLWHQNNPDGEPDDQEEVDRLIRVLAEIDAAAWARERAREEQLRLRASNHRIYKVFAGVELELPGVDGRT